MNNKKNKNKLSSSFLTTTPEKGKKTALKLLNKYAESFNTIKDENIILKKKIDDLNLNLKINKSIIDNFFSDKNITDKENSLINNIKQENKYLYEQKELLEKKNMELLNKIHLNELTYIEAMNQTREENELLKTKIFLLEQSCQKKDNIIDQQKSKLNMGRRGLGGYNKNEVYITNPSKVVNNINNELLVYKDMYRELTNIIKDNRLNMEKYEKKIIELQNENQILRQEYKSHIFNTNKERETLMNTIQRERNFINTQKNLSEDSKKSKNKNKKNGKKETKKIDNYQLSSITETCDNLIDYEKFNRNNKYKKYLDEKNKKNEKSENLSLFSDDYFINKINRKQFEHEDFIEIIKIVGLTLEKFEYMSKLKSYSKFTEIIEMLLNLVKDKERHMAILKKENEYLNENNFKLNEENISLTNQIKLKESIIKNMQLKQNNKKENNANTNNTNINTNNNFLNSKLKNTINLYKEYLDNNQKEDILSPDVIYNIKPTILENQNIHYSKTFSNGENSQKKENNNDTIVYNNDNIKEEEKKDDILEENSKKLNINEEKNINSNNENSTAVRIPNDIAKKNFGNNKFLGTLMSVTSSEFREGCPGPDSFFSTMKFDEMNGTQKTNGLKEIQKFYMDNQDKS